MLGVRLPAAAAPGVAAALAAADVHASVRGTSLRLSPHLWTTEEDVARLGEALGEALR
jgi:selenocysteine lyase/cysteine desulfurase